jgi:glutamine synthetase adenylyltransferase
MKGAEVYKGISSFIVVLVGLLGLLGTSGCGGGDSSISKAEYDQQLELVCNKGLSQREETLGEIAQEYKTRDRNASAKELAQEQSANVRKLMAVYRGTTEEIEGIGQPEEEEKLAEELVKAREDVVAKVEADPSAAIANAGTIFTKASNLAEKFGIASCAK